jgi:L-lactate dehydrogenase complex protein LldG
MALPDTSAARASIMRTLRAAAPMQSDLKTPATTLDSPPDLTPYLRGPFGRGTQGERVAPASLIAVFEAAARGWRAEVLRATPANWAATVRTALDARGCRRIAIGAASPLQPSLDAALGAQPADGAQDSGLVSRPALHVRRFDQAIESWKNELFDDIDAGVTSAVAGIADTGTLVLLPSAAEPRTLSLVPPVHVAVLHASNLYAGLPAAMHALTPWRDMPTNLVLITGPSKTADIQQVLAYGAHGPKELVIVLVDDLAA